MTSTNSESNYIRPERYLTYDYTMTCESKKSLDIYFFYKCAWEDLILKIEKDNNRVLFAFKDQDSLPFFSGRFSVKLSSAKIEDVPLESDFKSFKLHLEFEEETDIAVIESYDEKHPLDPKSAFILAAFLAQVIEYEKISDPVQKKALSETIDYCVQYAASVRYIEALLRMHHSCVSAGKHEEARSYLDMALIYDNPLPFFFKALECCDTKKYKSAEQYFVKSFNLGYPDSMLCLAELYSPFENNADNDLINPEKSFQAYQKYNEITGGKSAYCLYGLSQFYREGVVVEKNRKRAEELCKEAKQIAPDIEKKFKNNTPTGSENPISDVGGKDSNSFQNATSETTQPKSEKSITLYGVPLRKVLSTVLVGLAGIGSCFIFASSFIRRK